MAASTDVVTGRRLVLGNADVRISYVVAASDSPLYRNAVGDEIVYIESGRALVETVFGPLHARQGDTSSFRGRPRTAGCPSPVSRCARMPSRPTATSFRRSVTCPDSGSCWSMPRSASVICTPRPNCARRGHRRRGVGQAPRRDGGIVGTRYVYAEHPFDVVGWDGCLYPYTFNISDFEPLTGRVHQPPPAHQAFEGENFVICNFVPRKVDYHPLAIPVPYYHSNVDSDEVLFYVGGDYEARKGSGIGQGSVSLHPGGHAHGPQRGAVEASVGTESFDELAVMVDTFRPLELGEGALACEDPEYAWSWAGRVAQS